MEVNNEHVIKGNSVTMRCNIPAFVADYVNVASWLDGDGLSYTATGTKFG